MATTQSLIQSYIDAFNRHDIEGTLSLLSEDIIHDINEGARETGKEAFRKFKMHMDECYREQLSECVIMAEGTRGAMECTCSGTYLKTDPGLPEATGQQYSIPAAAFFEVKGDKISRITSYYSLKGWLAAIG